LRGHDHVGVSRQEPPSRAVVKDRAVRPVGAEPDLMSGPLKRRKPKIHRPPGPAQVPTTTRKRVGILVFPSVEVLDFAGPFEVFSVTRLDEDKRREEASPFETVLVAEEPGVVIATGGLRVVPNYTLDNCPPLDILLVPGGWGVRSEIENKTLVYWVSERGRVAEIVAGVCTGSMLLGKAGLLDGHTATTHWKSLDWMRQSFPGVTVIHDLHVVEDGELVTSAGISAGIDLALRVVALYHGEEVAGATAAHMEYRYPDDNRRRVDVPSLRQPGNGRWWTRLLSVTGVGRLRTPR
jgi:transcriptional regulator GlxA family with amidase domain